jgi:integrase
LQLRRQDVGQEAIRVLSTESERTKSGRWREIPLTDNAKDALEHLNKDSYILPRIRPDSMSRTFMRCATRAGVGGTLHSLRHTYISHLVMANVPLRVVQVLAGHAHYVTTERYAHLSPGHLQDAGKSINL